MATSRLRIRRWTGRYSGPPDPHPNPLPQAGEGAGTASVLPLPLAGEGRGEGAFQPPIQIPNAFAPDGVSFNARDPSSVRRSQRFAIPHRREPERRISHQRHAEPRDHAAAAAARQPAGPRPHARADTEQQRRHAPHQRPQPGPGCDLPEVGDERRHDQQRCGLRRRHRQAQQAHRDRRQPEADDTFDETGEHEHRTGQREREQQVDVRHGHQSAESMMERWSATRPARCFDTRRSIARASTMACTFAAWLS